MPAKKAAKTKPNRPAKTPDTNRARIRKLAKHSSFKLTKKSVITKKPLPGVRELVGGTVKIILSNKRLFIGAGLVFAILQFIFTKGLGTAFDIVATKNEVHEYVGDESKSLGTSYALFNYLVGSFNGQVSEASGAYQLFLTVITILAVIWLVRQVMSGEKPQLRDGFYKGMYPLVPFVLLLLVISLQLLPALIGNFIFSTVIGNGLAVTFLEKFIWFVLFVILLVLSLYMILSSAFALIISTLPDVRPVQALRSAREIVMHRRLGIFARIIILPIIGFSLAILIFIPLIMFVPVLAEPVFLVYVSLGLVVMTVYMYNFYRALL